MLFGFLILAMSNLCLTCTTSAQTLIAKVYSHYIQLAIYSIVSNM